MRRLLHPSGVRNDIRFLMSTLRRYFQHLASNGHRDWLFVLPGLLLLALFGLPILRWLPRPWAILSSPMHSRRKPFPR
jgi:hypothetical protein